MSEDTTKVLEQDRILNRLFYNLFEYFDVPQERLDAHKNTVLRGFKGTEFNEEGFLESLEFSAINFDILDKRMFLGINTDHLISLEFQDCEIRKIDENFLADLKNLRVFSVPNCQIKSIPDKIFEKNSNITFVDLSYNRLKNLPCGIFKIFENDQRVLIKVKRNPLQFVISKSAYGIDNGLRNNYKKIREIYCD